MEASFGADYLRFHYIGTDSFLVSFKAIEGLLEVLKKIKDDFNFSDLDSAHEL